ARRELHERTGALAGSLTEHEGALRFEYRGNLGMLLGLRSCIAAYQMLHFAVPRPKALLGHQHFTALVGAIDHIRSLHPPGAFATLRINAAGDDSQVMNRLKDELAARLGLAVADEGDLLLRLRRAPGGWELLLRLSPRPLATRAWRVCNYPGAPNATLAYAIARLSEPQARDVIVNLCCGSGTLLAERLLLGAAQRATGCDIDEAALRCASENLAAARLAGRIALEAWDATATPLPSGSVDVILADLPFGQLVGSHASNLALYPRLVGEATRLAAPGARMVLLTHELRLLERSLADVAEYWQVENVVRVRSGGMTPGIFVLRRLAT
ncbi:MAG TPA: methyltransferase domain-containing protein, partial [Roseiflexaceae bacterium]|nr:methyltransferase domain-containing protein [Roseiflexaceae bacterium]